MQTLIAVAIGLAFGVVFERYGFCMNSAVTDVFLFRDTRKLKGLLVAILASAVLFNLLIATGVTKSAATALWPTTIFAGILFGIGMNLAGGCVSGTLFKMGQGYVASLVAFLGITLGLGTMGILMSLMPLPASGMEAVQTKSLPELLGVNPFAFAVSVCGLLLLGYWAWSSFRAKAGAAAPTRTAIESGWSSYAVGGLLIAGLNTVFFAAFSSTLGLAGLMAYSASGLAFLANGTWARTNPMFGYLMSHPEHALIGVVFLIGAIVSALTSGRFQLRMPVRRQVISSIIGGYLMGVATALMIGCNVTHILGGLPQFGLGSVVATLGIVIGAWLGAKILTGLAARAA
jgi:uncharacterized membrane protein YedE/YeeE